MKRAWFFSAMVLLSTVIGAQDYQISFAVLGDIEAKVDSVVVHNIEQGDSITIRGNDILHLLASTTGISDLNRSNGKVQIYPNPFSDRTTIVFQNDKQGLVQLSLFDLTGKIVAQNSIFQSAGITIVEVGGLPVGVYVIQIDTETSIFSEVILSNNTSGNHPEIIFKGSGENVAAPVATLKSSNMTSELMEMQYNTGETLAFTAYLGDLISESIFVPVSSSTISFDFRPKLEDISDTATIAIDGGVLQVIDESGNIIKLSFPSGAVMDSTTVSLTLLGMNKNLPINERKLRTFEIRPSDLSLYRPVEISIEYNDAISEIEHTALFRMRSESFLTPLGDHAYSDDNKSLTATTLILGDFAEGEMTLEQVNTQFDLLVSFLGISWGSTIKSTVDEGHFFSDGALHKAIWDEWKEKAAGFLKLMSLRLLLGYYDDLEQGEPTFEEELEILCKEVISRGVQEVLDQDLPEDPCDRDYTHTIADMVSAVALLGCEGSTFDLLNERFDQVLIDCGSFLTINSELNIESGGLIVTTTGVVPITTTEIGAITATVEGTGTLAVSGSADAGGVCTSIVSGETLVTVEGTRDAAYTFELLLMTEQNAVLTTICPDLTLDTPLVGTGLKVVHLSRANGYTMTIEEEVEGGTFVTDVTLNNPYTSLPNKNTQ